MIRILRRAISLFTGSRDEHDLEREMASHLAMLEGDLRRRGLTANEARVAARRRIGSIAFAKDLHRDARSLLWLEDLRRDLRIAVRTLRRTPAFTAVVVLTLALGIGATTTVFSVVNTLLLKPLPYRDADRLVRIVATMPPSAANPQSGPSRRPAAFTLDELRELRTRARTLSYIGTTGPGLLSLVGYEDGGRLQGATMSVGTLEMLGVAPLIGRLFSSADESPSAQPVVIISAAIWRRYFAADPAVIGRSISLETVLGRRRPASPTVVGVMPDRFEFPAPRTDFWLPIVDTPAAARGFRGLAVGRLADGVSREAASAEIATLIRELRRGQPGNDGAVYSVTREQDEIVSPVRPALVVLIAAVGCLLLIACVNVANLVLARSHLRSREIAIRTVLGAGRGRVVRYLLAECLLLALSGGTLAVALTFGGLRLLRALATTLVRIDLGNTFEFPRVDEIAVDGAVLAFSLLAALVTGIVCGLAPAWQSARANQSVRLKEAADTHTTGAPTRLRQTLVAVEIALAMVLLVAGSLLARSLVNLRSVDTGYRADNVLTFQVSVPLSRYPDARLREFAEQVAARLRAVPGIRAAAYASQLPMVALRDTYGGLWRHPDPNRPPAPSGADARLVSSDYFKTMGIRVVAGRGFVASDTPPAPRVLLINQALARKEFANEDPLGQSMFIARDPMPWTVVGIVADVRQFGLDQDPEPQFFIDLRQATASMNAFPVGAYYAVRVDRPAGPTIAAIRSAVRELDADAALFNVAPMDEIVATRLARPKMYAVLVGVFAALGLVLALVGMSGVVGYVTSQRTREIGIRLSLGAQRIDVIALVVRQTMIAAGSGLLVGLVAATAATRYLETLLFQLTPWDPGTFTMVSLLFAAVAAAAAWVPARRAAKIDPLVALRDE